jgi:hypothetical protein
VLTNCVVTVSVGRSEALIPNKHTGIACDGVNLLAKQYRWLLPITQFSSDPRDFTRSKKIKCAIHSRDEGGARALNLPARKELEEGNRGSSAGSSRVFSLPRMSTSW